MITIKKTIDLPETYPLVRLGPLDKLLFFDIETTGFSGDYASLYLIGCTYFSGQEKSWQLIQWFADSKEAEPEILIAFLSFMKNYTVLIHFNGDGFDIPFLIKRCAKYQLTFDLQNITSFDIYRKVKPYKTILQLESLKQKAIEKFLGIKRADMYSGGQLVDVYKEYLLTHEAFLYRLLILHNEDDLKGMPSILPILQYPDFFEHSFVPTRQELENETLSLICESEYCLPVPLHFTKGEVKLCAIKNQLTIKLPLFSGTLKYFYPNYKDYYYLIYEDNAIHKSVAEFVDKSAKKKATADTCYTKMEGCFLPQFDKFLEPALRKERKDKITYTPFKEALLTDDDTFVKYLGQVLRYLLGRR